MLPVEFDGCGGVDLLASCRGFSDLLWPMLILGTVMGKYSL